MRKKLLLAAALLSALPAQADVYSARNFSMGGAGVASSEYDAAAASNGALLTRFDESDDIALILPSIGIEASDQEDVINTLEDIPDLYDDLEANIDGGNTAAATANAENIIKKLEDVDGNPLLANVAGLIGVAIPSKTLAIAFDVRTAADVVAVGDYDPTDQAIFVAAIASGDSTLLDNTQSSGLALGAAVTEATVTLATEFSMGESSAFSVAVTPKYQRVDTLIYAVTVQNYDSDDFDDNTNDDANFNVDVGVAFSMGEHWVLGLSGRNLISEEYDTDVVQLGGQTFQGTYQVDPTAVLGAAFTSGWFVATVEGDLVKNKGFENFDETQFLRAGVEFNAFSWVQLRAGYRYDMEDTAEDVVTAGLGFSPFDVFHFDISGSYGENDTYGAALDLRFTF